MDRVKALFASVDNYVDRHANFVKSFFKKYFSFISTLFFVLIVAVFAIRVFYSRPRIVASLIEDDIAQITLALEKIDVECNILGFEDTHNEIDFLNTKAFEGSQVGPLSLAYPQKWAGPYLHVNPTIQETFYEIVRAKDGIFVMPGRGVTLPNGLIVGKDFQITMETVVANLLRAGGSLTYDDKKFAVKLTFKVGDWDSWFSRKATIQKLDRMVQEFNEAMPFTKRSTEDRATHNYV